MKLKNDKMLPNIPNEVYHANRTHVSSSGLKLLLKNPKLYYEQYVLGKTDEEVPAALQNAFDFGSYIHARILEPHLIDEEFATFTGKMRRGKDWEAFKENNPEKIILSESQIRVANCMIDRYENSGIEIGKHGYNTEVPFSSFFTNGKPELTACTNILGVDVKVRFDYYKKKKGFASIQDVKTTSEQDLSLENVQNICDRLDYDLSAALYCDVAAQITGVEHDFYFLFMSKKPPYDVQIFRASATMLERGREKYESSLLLLKEARDTGIYYEQKILELQ